MRPTWAFAWLVVCLAVFVIALPGCGGKKESPTARTGDEDSGGTGLVVADDNEPGGKDKGPSVSGARPPDAAELIDENFPESPDTPLGTFERFMVSWKRGDLDLLLNYVRPEDRESVRADPEKMKLARERYVQTVLVDYKVSNRQWLWRNKDVMMFELHIETRDTQNGETRQGQMLLKVKLIGAKDEREDWAVDLDSVYIKYE